MTKQYRQLPPINMTDVKIDLYTRTTEPNGKEKDVHDFLKAYGWDPGKHDLSQYFSAPKNNKRRRSSTRRGPAKDHAHYWDESV